MAQHNKDTSINVYFKTDSFSLETSQYENLKSFFSAFPQIKQITGYSDSTGDTDYNFSLSKKRAFAVFALLQTYHDSLKEDLVTSRGESSSLPGLWMNRRVQVTARLNNNTAVAQSGNNRSDTSASDTSAERRIIKKEDDNRTDTAASHLSSVSPKLKADDISLDTVSNFYLENVYFLPDKPIVTTESFPHIRELATILNNHPEETIEIIGHINYQSSFDSTYLRDLFKLSEQRAKTVYDYLAELGVSKARMSYKGVGNSQPAYPMPENDDERRKNMRVQIVRRK
jgi:outer membrane protein OmpA-like peptidoglycan-associated protein